MLPERWFNLKMWEIAPKLCGENWFSYKCTWLEIWIFSNAAYLSVEKGSWRNQVRWLHAFPACHSVEISAWIPVSKQSCIAIRRSTKHTLICGNAPLWTRLVGSGWETVWWVNPQKLTLVLFIVGRREGEESYFWYKQKWETQVWTQEPTNAWVPLLALVGTPCATQSPVHVLYFSLVWEDTTCWEYICFSQQEFFYGSEPLLCDKGGHRFNYCFLSLY